MIHCWESRRESIMEEIEREAPGGDWNKSPRANEWLAAFWSDENATCLLEDGHDGPHEWTPDSSITIRFVEPPGAGTEGA
jgi:hypothetical protein